METTTEYRLIDLHADTIGRCYNESTNLDAENLHFKLSARPKHLRLCQAAAVFIPDELRGKAAQDYFMGCFDLYRREITRKAEGLNAVYDLRFLPRRLREKPAALFLTVEGGAVLAGDLGWVEKLWDFGVRMMTLTWNGANELCGGAGSGGGFAPFGRQAVAEMERLGMAVDVSHLSDEGFWQLCAFATAPFCASHSNSRSVCDHRRNLTDDMFREIARRGGVVGMNYCRTFVTEEGKGATIAALLRHVHHFLELGGEDTIALGSDFDGADLPDDLAGTADLERLVAALEESVGKELTRKILFDNAYRYLSGLAKDQPYIINH